MAQETEQLLFEVVLDIPKVKENAEIARAALASLRIEKEKTQKMFESKLLGEEVYRKTMQALLVEIDKTEKELVGYSKTLLEHQTKQKSANAIAVQAVKSFTALESGLTSLINTESKSAKSSQQLAEQIKLLNAERKREQAISEATAGSMDALDDLISELEDEYRGLTKAKRDDLSVGGVLLTQINDLTRIQDKNRKVMSDSGKSLKDYIRDTNILGVNLGQTQDSFKSAWQGADLFGKFLLTARGAALLLAAALPIAILTGLYLILTKSQKGMDFLARTTAGLSSIFSAFTSKVIAIGDALANAWENPKQGIIDFGKFVQQNLINRFTALGVIIDGIRSRDWGKVGDGLIQMGTGAEGAATNLKKAYDQGVALANLSIQIKEDEIKLNTERARSEKFIERQKQIAQDTTKSVETRSKAERAAFAASQKIQSAEEALQKKRVQLAQAEAKANQNNREAREKVSQEEAKLDDIAKNRIGQRTELQNQLNTIEAEGIQKVEENAKKLAAEQVAEAELALVVAKQKGDSTIEIEEEVLRRQVALIHAKAEAEKVGADVTVAQKKLINAKAQAEELEAIKAHAQLVQQRTFAIMDAQLAARLSLVQKGTQAEFDLQKDALSAQLDREKSDAVDRIKNRRLLTAELRRLDAQYNADVEQLTQQFEQSQITQTANAEAQKIQIRQDASEATLSDLRLFDGQRIDLEEKTQLKLLEIEKKFALEKVNPTDTKAKEKLEEDFQVRRNSIIAKAAAARRDLNRQIDADQIADAKAVAESRLALSKAGSHEELQARIDGINAERDAALNVAHLTADQKKAINDKANREIEDAELEHNKRIIGQVLDVYSQATSAASSVINAQIDSATKALDDQQQAALDSAALSAEAREGIERNYQKKKAKLEKEAAEQRKKIALVEATINTAKAILEAAPNPFLMALAGAVGLVQIGIISSQQFAKGGAVDPSQGGLVNGPSHAQGGIPMYHKSGRYVGEMEGDEIILTRGVYRNPVLRNLASYANQMAGGVAIEGTPKIASPRTYTPFQMAYGGVMSLSQSQPMIQPSTINLDSINRLVTQSVVNGVAQAVKSMPAPQVQVKDIQSGVGRRVRVENRADY
ncbi:hypothetical protein GO755_24765 [Spirosoma sp. HMF4905]|uniref:Uncharacterized protein n=1 Tax=Spirosoma arboris TaxID=2682092 RepID=A0A7K1SI75_9BACT|nr:hypothetical protein [Spirosoma arboris]MVM33276.1 hypothetical protein [Spirosoma arboris]